MNYHHNHNHVACLRRGPQLLPKRFTQTVWFSASSFNLQYLLLSLRSSSSCLRCLPRLPITPTLPSVFPLVTVFRMQFLCKMWTIQLAVILCIVCSKFLSSLTHCDTSFFTISVHLTFSTLLQHHLPNLSTCFSSNFRSFQLSAPYKTMFQM